MTRPQRVQKIMMWDLDGTLYPDSHELQDAFAQAAYKSVREIVDPNLSDNEIKQKLEESRSKFGDSFSGLVGQGESQRELHAIHNSRLDHSLIEQDKTLAEFFEASKKAGIRHVILTHGHFDWSKRVLEHRGIDQYFADEDIISVEKIKFIKKHTGPEAFEVALDRIGAKAEDVVMIEDRTENLIHPHEMGMTTIHVHYGEVDKSGPVPDYVDHRCATPQDAISYVSRMMATATRHPDKPHL